MGDGKPHMKHSVVNIPHRAHLKGPDPRCGILQPKQNQLLSGNRVRQGTRDGHPGALVYKAVGNALPYPQADTGNGLTPRRSDGNRIGIRNTSPQFHDKSVVSRLHPDLHRNTVPVSISQPSLIMMEGIPLIPARQYHRPAALYRHQVQIPGKRRRSCMIPIACTQPETNHHRLLEGYGKPVRILDSQHNIIFLIGRHLFRNHVKIPQILLTFLQPHHHNIRIRSRSLVGQPPADTAAATPAIILPWPFSSRLGTTE